MGFRMIALLVVDKIRTMLMESLVKSTTPDVHAEDNHSPDYKDPDFYKADGAKVITMVDQRILANLVVMVCSLTRQANPTAYLDQPLGTIHVGGDENNIMFQGVITLRDLVEAASDAEVDHVVDFLMSKEICIDQTESGK